MLKIIRDASIKIDKHGFQGNEFCDTIVPLLSLEAVNINPVRLDKIIIDESQDLLKNNYIEIFDSILIKDLTGGNGICLVIFHDNLFILILLMNQYWK
jgi:hypothetical protein